VGLQPQKIAETGNFWYKFSQKGYTPYAIFTKFGLGRTFKVRTLVPNGVTVSEKMWEYSPQKLPQLEFFV